MRHATPPVLILTLTAAVLFCSSCEQKNGPRAYTEITVTPSSSHAMSGSPHGDPHAFMNDSPSMSFEHPPIPDDMQLPPGQNTPEMQQALAASVAHAPLSWATPKGWSEEKGSGMRMVTFRAQGKSGGIECSIVSLGGMAGGLESNVARWMGQLKVAVPPDDQLKAFLDRQEAVQTKGDFAVTLIDLTQYTQDAGAPSMIAGIARMPDMTVFVKMTGSRQAVTEQRQALRGLCASLSIN